MHAFRFKTLARQACTLFQSSGPKVLVWLGACTGDALTRYRNVFFFTWISFADGRAPPPQSVRLRYSHAGRLLSLGG